jgi:hypothetical protein
MPREKRKWQQPRGERPDAEHWGGPTRKSEEGWECGGSKGVGSSGGMRRSTGNRRKLLRTTKPFTISKQLVSEAFKAVKAKAGAAGVDKQSIEDFEKDLQDNLYKIWNRMASGSYFPPPVKAVAIAKKHGGERMLGVPMAYAYCISSPSGLGMVLVAQKPRSDRSGRQFFEAQPHEGQPRPPPHRYAS